MENKKGFADRFDWTLAFILLLFLIVSLLAISSAQTTGQYASYNFVSKQLFWYVVGCVIIGMVMFFEPEQYKRMAWYIYGIGVFLLAILAILPESMDLVEPRNGAKSWFHLPIGDIQPAEFMKTFYILGLARLITYHHEQYVMKTVKTDFILLGKIF